MGKTGSNKSRRVALLVGIEDYDLLPPLATPYQDVALLARTLQPLGFEVDVVGAGTGPKSLQSIRERLIVFRDHVRALAAQIRTGGPANIAPCALFYFAGHGLRHRDNVYMLDEGAVLTSEASLRSHGLTLSEIIDDLRDSDEVPKLILLDCCQTTSRLDGASADLRLPGELPNGMLIGFSTHMGGSAADGGDGRSPYAEALCRHLPTLGASISDILVSVSGAVRTSTSRTQSCMHLETLCAPLILSPQRALPLAAGLTPGRNEPQLSPERDKDEPVTLDRLRVCKFRDGDGRSAWYVILLHDGAERGFVAAAARGPSIDINDHGRILAREYGAELSDDLCDYVARRYGPAVGGKLKQAQARLNGSAGATHRAALSPR